MVASGRFALCVSLFTVLLIVVRAEKIQKLSEQLAKSPSLKLKDLTKFLDTIAANIDDCFDLDLFGTAPLVAFCFVP